EVLMRRDPSAGFPGSIIRLRFGGATSAVDVSGVQAPVAEALPPVAPADGAGPSSSTPGETASTPGGTIPTLVTDDVALPGVAPSAGTLTGAEESAGGSVAWPAGEPMPSVSLRPVARDRLQL